MEHASNAAPGCGPNWRTARRAKATRRSGQNDQCRASLDAQRDGGLIVMMAHWLTAVTAQFDITMHLIRRQNSDCQKVIFEMRLAKRTLRHRHLCGCRLEAFGRHGVHGELLV